MPTIDPSKVPFFANAPDDLHCYQASMSSILGYFLPEQTFTYEQLDQMSNKHEGLATWPQKMLINLRDMGFEVMMIEGFDGRDFIERGGDYLREAFGDETADWQIKHSNIPEEQALYQQAYDKGIHIENRLPTLDEIRQRLGEGYLVQCTVNSNALSGKPGYVGHSVVVLRMDDQHIEFHDPGLPPVPNRVETLAAFERAWAYPTETAKNYTAIRPKE